MHENFYIIKKEHDEIKIILGELEDCMKKRDETSYHNGCKLVKNFGKVWDEHEEREDNLFDVVRKLGTPIPYEQMLLKEHVDLRGHWKVLNDSIKSGDMDKFFVALDTDGRMLIEKFIKHIGKEEAYFDSLEAV